ncbi:MAG: serine hydrolase domain-containing protein [Candidatus Binataceae bacterium]
MARRFVTVITGFRRTGLLYASMLLLSLAAAIAFAQKPADVTGDWFGVLQVKRGSLHLALHVTADSAGKLSVTLDSLDQNAMGLPGSDAALKGNSFSFEIPSVAGTYTGTLGADGKSISGTWNQGVPLPLVFIHQSAATAVKPADVAGDWNGAWLVGGGSQRLALHVKADSAGKLSVTLDFLDQHTMGVPGNAVLKGHYFSFEVPSIAGTYTGSLDDDVKSSRGTWSAGGVTMPLVLIRQGGGPTPTAIPTPTPAPATPPLALDHLKPILDRELAPVLEHGLLSKASGGGGLVIGAMDHGERLVLAYGTAKPDSIFEIGSISKTFTGLVLAQMVIQKKVTLDQPIRTLLPPGFVAKPEGAEITLVDLATQHSGLPRMPDNFKPKNSANPYVDYGAPQLHDFVARHGVAKPADAPFLYSNLGFGLLGYGLSLRAGVPYGQLLSTEITGPLHMSDTVITLSPTQRTRLIEGYNNNFDPAGPWDFDVFAGAGAIRSTAADLLTYLDGNLHPDKYATGAAADSPAATLPAAIALDHQVRAKISVSGDKKIALAWWFDTKTGSYSHAGGTGGYTSMVLFNPKQDRAIVVLYNRDNTDIAAPQFVERVAENVFELMSGKPSIPLDFISEDERVALIPPTFADSSIEGPYHCTLTAFPLPATIKEPFKTAATGDIHFVADGKGKSSEGTWVHHIHAPKLDLTCKLKMVSGSYSVTSNGTGTAHSSWKLVTEESPRGCFQFFSPARPPVTTDEELIIMDTTGKTFYSTSINPFAVLSTVCQREAAH